jgi:hypothetical protein
MATESSKYLLIFVLYVCVILWEFGTAIVTGGRPRSRGGAPRWRSSKGAKLLGGAKRHGTMESSRGHRASRSDDGGELERSDEGWLDDGASAGTPRFVEEDDVRFLCEARGGWAIVPTQGPLGNKSSKWFRVFFITASFTV